MFFLSELDKLRKGSEKGRGLQIPAHSCSDTVIALPPSPCITVSIFVDILVETSCLVYPP